MINNLPFVSIIIPCRNEERFIGKCLDSIIAQDYTKDKIEILVVDGMSTDNTRGTLKDYIQKNPCVKILDNSKKVTPVAMNMGIKAACGDYILILSSHSHIDPNFVGRNIKNIIENEVDCVGGVMMTLPANDTILAQSIAIALSHPFGVGNAYFRIGSKEPKYVDTVPFGCYKKNVFDKIGLFNEGLIRNQDIEFNLRLKNANGKILLMPDIVSYYHARDSLKSLFIQNFWNGFWVIYSTKFAKVPFSMRHLIPCVFVSSLIGSASLSILSKYLLYLFVLISGSYLASNLFFSFRVSLQKRLRYFFPLSRSFRVLIP